MKVLSFQRVACCYDSSSEGLVHLYSRGSHMKIYFVQSGVWVSSEFWILPVPSLSCCFILQLFCAMAQKPSLQFAHIYSQFKQYPVENLWKFEKVALLAVFRLFGVSSTCPLYPQIQSGVLCRSDLIGFIYIAPHHSNIRPDRNIWKTDGEISSGGCSCSVDEEEGLTWEVQT